MEYSSSRTAELLDAATARAGGKLNTENASLEVKAIAMVLCQMSIARLLGRAMLDSSTKEGDCRQKFDMMTALLCPELRIDPEGRKLYKRVQDMILRDLEDIRGGE